VSDWKYEALEADSSKDAVLAARIAYWNLIQSTKTPEFYGFTKNLWGQDAISCEKVNFSPMVGLYRLFFLLLNNYKNT
jgi:hypothetical protein